MLTYIITVILILIFTLEPVKNKLFIKVLSEWYSVTQSNGFIKIYDFKCQIG